MRRILCRRGRLHRFSSILPVLDLKWCRAGWLVRPTARGGLPFGISNSIVQLQGSYLELLSVTGDVPEHSPGHFSFGAFNRDYLARHEGFSMLVLDTTDARADILSWREAGL